MNIIYTNQKFLEGKGTGNIKTNFLCLSWKIFEVAQLEIKLMVQTTRRPVIQQFQNITRPMDSKIEWKTHEAQIKRLSRSAMLQTITKDKGLTVELSTTDG